jgi:hypothetical protein
MFINRITIINWTIIIFLLYLNIPFNIRLFLLIIIFPTIFNYNRTVIMMWMLAWIIFSMIIHIIRDWFSSSIILIYWLIMILMIILYMIIDYILTLLRYISLLDRRHAKISISGRLIIRIRFIYNVWWWIIIMINMR